MMSEPAEILDLDLIKIGFITGGKKVFLYPVISSHAKTGELIAIIGRNGIGKSTLLRTIAGLQSPLAGIVRIEGRNLDRYSRNQLARKVGYISTEVVKTGDMRVYDLVSLGRFPYTDWFGRLDSFSHSAVMDSIKLSGMSDFAQRYLTELSDGERQRAMIAMVLARNASLIILDEPTAFLDIKSKYEILQLLHDLVKQQNKTVIFSTHDLHSAIDHADKIWLMLDRGIIEGTPEELILNNAFDELFADSPMKYKRSGKIKNYRQKSI